MEAPPHNKKELQVLIDKIDILGRFIFKYYKEDQTF
jgi:hypothetical protein